MFGRSTAVRGLIGATHQPSPFQMVSPFLGSEWLNVTFPGGLHAVIPFTVALNDDLVADPNGAIIPVTNFYVNPGKKPSNLPPYPG
jgi:hypothetical protein